MRKSTSLFSFIRGELIKRSYFKQLLYTYALVSCLLFFLFSAILIQYTNRDYQAALASRQAEIIAQSYDINQTLLKDVYSLSSALLGGMDLPRILYNADYPVELSLKAKQLQDQIRLASSLVYSVYFVNYEAGTILDAFNRGKISDHYDQVLLDFLKEQGVDHSPFYGLARSVKNPGSSTNMTVFSLILHPSTRGALVVNFDYDAYVRLLPADSGEYIDWLQVDRSGRVLAASDPSLPGTDYTDNALYQRIAEEEAPNGTFSERIDGKNCRVMFRHNLGQGITYISILNQAAVYTSNHLFRVVFLCGLAFIVLGLLAALLISLLVYRPFRHFKEQLMAGHDLSLAPQGSDMDDFTYLSGIYSEIVHANERLRQESRALLREKDGQTLKNLLTGADSGAGNTASYESLDQFFEKSLYQVLIISIDYPYRQQGDSADLGLLRYSVTNVMNELLEGKMLFLCMDMLFPDVVYVLNHDAEGDEALTAILLEAQNFFGEYFHVTLSFGLGERTGSLEELQSSFAGAQEALRQRFITGNGRIHQASALTLRPIGEQHYPHTEDSAILSAIRALAPEETKKELTAFFETISAYRFDQILRTILQLDTTLSRFEIAQELPENPLPWELSVIPLLDIAAVREYFTARCLTDIAELSEIRSHSAEKNELVEGIIARVDADILNPNLSVASLADEVGLSVNYLRSIFKENTGESLSGYITRKKVELICRLLAETDESIQDISDKLGFSTRNYFFTFFKKHMKMTPNEYRKQTRGTE